MCDLIQITPEPLFKQVSSSQQSETPLSQQTNSTTLSQQSQREQFETKIEGNSSSTTITTTTNSTQTLQLNNRYNNDLPTQQVKDNSMNSQSCCKLNQYTNNNQPSSQNGSQQQQQQQQLLQQYQNLDKLSLIQMLIEEKKKNQNLLKAYTRDTEKLKNEILQLQKELIRKQEKEFQSMTNTAIQISQNHKANHSACKTLFNSCNSEQIVFASANAVEGNIQNIKQSINCFTHTFSNLKQCAEPTFNNINLIQSYTPSTTTSQASDKSVQDQDSIQDINKGIQIAKLTSILKNQKQVKEPHSQSLTQSSHIVASPLLSPNLKLVKLNEMNLQSASLNHLSKSTADLEIKNIQTLKLLKFLEDLVIKCTPNNIFRENEKPTEKQIWKFVKTMTEEYVGLKKQDIQYYNFFTVLKDTFKASSLEKIIQLAKLQKEEVQMLRKKMYLQTNQVTQSTINQI